MKIIITFLILSGLLFSCVDGGPGSTGAGSTADNTPILSTFVDRPFPTDNPWNEDVSNAPVDPNSDVYINSLGRNSKMHADFGTWWDGAPNGQPFVVVSGSQKRVPVTFEYARESDPGPYPIPADAPIQGGPNATGDRHLIVVDKDNNMLYELYRAFPDGNGGWTAVSGAVFDLSSNKMRPAGHTSADAAGLPIYPGLVRYNEVMVKGEINHALRFTANRTRHAYVYPARHAAGASNDPSLPPMGMRVRLKASYDISPYPESVQVILRALKKYGMILADNGASWMISGEPNDSWNDYELHTIKQVPGSAFEVIKMGELNQ